MGQKTHPKGFRIGIIQPWVSTWFAKVKDYGQFVAEDAKIRKFIKKKLYAAGVSRILIDRKSQSTTITVVTAKPGIVVGRGGQGIEELKQDVLSMTESTKTSTLTQTSKTLERVESAEQAYVMLFNVTQAQVSALHKDNDYFQQYTHYQTALGALLKSPQFPSNVAYNIKALLDMMDDILKIRENSGNFNDNLYDEYKKEFIPNMEEIGKSSCEEFSFEDRQRFMMIAAKAIKIFKRTTMDA